MIVDELRNAILEKLKKGQDPLEGFFAQQEIKESIMAVLVAGRNLLLEGPPGIGKTTCAKIIASMLPPRQFVKGCRFNCDPQDVKCTDCLGEKNLEAITISGSQRFTRVQGSPELMPEDLAGEIDLVAAMKFGISDPRAFTPGKIQKANRKVLFIDELNRVPERTQSTLLQVLQEGTTTIAGFDIDVNVDTVAIATANPEESAGAVRLSETLQDRFEIIRVSYPSKEQELEIVKRYGRMIEGVAAPEAMTKKMVDISQTARSIEGLGNELSVRTSLSMFENSQAFAKMRNDNKIQLSDVKRAAKIAIGGRLSHVESRYDNMSSLVDSIIQKATEQ